VIGAPTHVRRRLLATQGLGVFRHRNYRLFYSGQAVSLIGTWMQQVAQAWLVLQLTGDPFWLGVTMAAQLVPVMVLGLFAGVAADSLPKRPTLIVVQAAMMILAATLAIIVIAGIVELWMILVLAVMLGIASSVDMPVRQSFAVDLVGRREIGTAVALNSAMFNGARVIGPAVAGLAIGAFGVGVAFALNALSFLAVIIAISLMRDSELHPAPRLDRPSSSREVIGNLADGLRYIRGTPLVFLALLTLGLVATTGMNFTVLMPEYATQVLGGDATVFGFLMAASGVGSVVAALLIAFRGRGRPLQIATGAILLGIAEVALALTGSYGAALVLMVLVGYGGISMAATANTTIQLAVPDELRGRVMSAYTTTFASSGPIGGLLFGGIASVAGVAIAIGIGGALSGLVGLAALGWLVRHRAAATAARLPGGIQSLVAPNTSAAFSPPNPNEVLSTRR
jgi:MFS family permease